MGLHPALSRDCLNVARGITKEESTGFHLKQVAQPCRKARSKEDLLRIVQVLEWRWHKTILAINARRASPAVRRSRRPG